MFTNQSFVRVCLKLFSSSVLILISSNSYAVKTINCEAPKSFVGKAICGSPTLSSLDDQLYIRYEDARNSGANLETLKKDHSIFLQDLIAKCTDEQCIEQSYKQRIAAFTPSQTRTPVTSDTPPPQNIPGQQASAPPESDVPPPQSTPTPQATQVIQETEKPFTPNYFPFIASVIFTLFIAFLPFLTSFKSRKKSHKKSS